MRRSGRVGQPDRRVGPARTFQLARSPGVARGDRVRRRGRRLADRRCEPDVRAALRGTLHPSRRRRVRRHGSRAQAKPRNTARAATVREKLDVHRDWGLPTEASARIEPALRTPPNSAPGIARNSVDRAIAGKLLDLLAASLTDGEGVPGALCRAARFPPPSGPVIVALRRSYGPYLPRNAPGECAERPLSPVAEVSARGWAAATGSGHSGRASPPPRRGRCVEAGRIGRHRRPAPLLQRGGPPVPAVGRRGR